MMGDAEVWVWLAISLATVALMALVGLVIGLSRLSSHVDAVEAELGLRVEMRLARMAETDGGLVACVTGANAGIGLELSKRLAVCGATVVMLCRSRKRGEAALELVRSAARRETGTDPGDRVRLVLCDVSAPDSVRACASELRSSLDRVDLLYLNAGTMPVEAYGWGTALRSITTGPGRGGGPGHFLETGRAFPGDSHFLRTPAWSRRPAAEHAGAPHLLATHVLGHALLADLLARNGLLGRGRVPELDEAKTDSDLASAAPWHGDAKPFAAVRPPALVPGTPVDPALWERPDAGRGGGGARVIWTGSRAAAVDASILDLLPAALDSPAPGPELRRQDADAYGEAKAVVDALAEPMQRSLRDGSGLGGGTDEASGSAACPRVSVSVVCPGFVATDIAPWFMTAAVPALEVIRPVACGQQLTARRGIAPHLAVAVASAPTLSGGGKLITHRGMLTRAVNGWRPQSDEDRAAAALLVRTWLNAWATPGN